MKFKNITFLKEKESSPSNSNSKSPEEIIKSNLINNEVLVVTVSNNGYEETTLNWILSLKKIKINKFLVICLDQELANYLSHKGYIGNILLAPPDWHGFDLTSHYTLWNTEEFNKIMHARLKIMQKLLEFNVTLLFSDSDVVWLNENVLSHIEFIYQQSNAEIIFSLIPEINLPHIIAEKKKYWYCIGFFYVKPNLFTHQLFVDVLEYQRLNPNLSEEQNLNLMFYQMPKYKQSNKIGTLDPIVFPCGNIWHEKKLNEKFKIKPSILHACAIFGKQSKIDAFRQHNVWLIDEENSNNFKHTDL